MRSARDPQWCQNGDCNSLIERLVGKAIVIIPINDGSILEHDSTGENPIVEDGIGRGKHLSLVVASCAGTILRARHFDFFCRNADIVTPNRIVAEETMHGLRRLLEAQHRGDYQREIPLRTYEGYDFLTYVKTPHQVGDGGIDMGACGPFVWALGSWFAERWCSSHSTKLGLIEFKRKKRFFKKRFFRKSKKGEFRFKAAAVRKQIFDAVEEERKLLDKRIGIADYTIVADDIRARATENGEVYLDDREVERRYLRMRDEVGAPEASSQ